MKVVVAYDVASDPHRKKLAELLANVLTRVQRSVFEGDVPPKVLDRWIGKAVTLLDDDTDSLRVYHLCAACAPNVEAYGRALPPLEQGEVRIL